MAWEDDRHPRGPDGKFIGGGSLSTWAKEGAKGQRAQLVRNTQAFQGATQTATSPKPAAPPAVQRPLRSTNGVLHHDFAKAVTVHPEVSKGKVDAIVAVMDKLHPHVQKLLEKAPLEHLELAGGEVFNGAQDVPGVYFEGSHDLKINASAPLFGKHDVFTPGVTGAIHHSSRSPEDASRKILVHELGHHVHLVANDKIDHIVKQAFESTKGAITQYASWDRHEYFAETFAAYHFHNAQLKEHDPVGYQMMRDVFGALKPRN